MGIYIQIVLALITFEVLKVLWKAAVKTWFK